VRFCGQGSGVRVEGQNPDEVPNSTFPPLPRLWRDMLGSGLKKDLTDSIIPLTSEL
jgi:hypothetical protein